MVKILLKDGTFLVGSIYKTNKPGEYPLIDHESINSILNISASNNPNECFVNFQTEMINGRFHNSNVLWYEITHEDNCSYDEYK